MSEIKVNKISPRLGTDVTLGDSSDTFTVPSGATLTTTNATVNLPASVGGLGTGITNAQLAGSIDVTSKITGVVPSANLQIVLPSKPLISSHHSSLSMILCMTLEGMDYLLSYRVLKLCLVMPCSLGNRV